MRALIGQRHEQFERIDLFVKDALRILSTIFSIESLAYQFCKGAVLHDKGIVLQSQIAARKRAPERQP